MKVLVIHNVKDVRKKAIVEMTEDEYLLFSKCDNIYFSMLNNESPSYYKNYNDDVFNAMILINFAFDDEPDSDDIRFCTKDIERKYFGTFSNNPNISDISGVDKLICTGFSL